MRNRLVFAIAVLAVVGAGGCSGSAQTSEQGHSEPSQTPERQAADPLTASRGEHDRDGGQPESGEHGGNEEGEESGTEFALNESYDQVRNGARLVLAYDAHANAFNGTVDNTTNDTLTRVRVEVHLSDGRELGPTTPVDLAPGERREVSLTATGRDFDAWTAHPEVGSGEQGHGEEGGEHEGQGRGEHDEDGEHDREPPGR